MGSSFYQPGTVNENVLESDFVPLRDTPRGIAHSQISDFWRGCRLSPVSGSRGGAEPVVVLYAIIGVLNLMRAATMSKCREIKISVTWALLGSLKTSRAVFIIFI